MIELLPQPAYECLMHHLGLQEYAKLLVLSKSIFANAREWYSHHIRKTQPCLLHNCARRDLPTVVDFCVKYRINYIDLGFQHIMPYELPSLKKMKTIVKFTGLTHVPTLLPLLEPHTELKKLRVAQPGTPCKEWSKLSTFTHLEWLDLSSNYDFLDESLHKFNNLGKLRYLDLTFCRITDLGIYALTSFKSLQVLILSSASSDITDAGLSSLACITTLTELKLSMRRNLTDRGVATLSALPSLEKLALSSCDALTGQFLYAFKDSETLKEINLDYCRGLDRQIILSFPTNTPLYRNIFTQQFIRKIRCPERE